MVIYIYNVYDAIFVCNCFILFLYMVLVLIRNDWYVVHDGTDGTGICLNMPDISPLR